jgi:hypothetical protein
MTDDVVVDEQPQRSADDRSWLWLMIGILIVIAGASAIVYQVGHGSLASKPTAFSTAFTDDFNRHNSARLGNSSGGATWVSAGGTWSVVRHVAVLSTTADKVGVVLGGLVQYGAVEARVSGRGRCGVVARYVAPDTYLMLERLSEFGVWNLTSVEKGHETVLGKVDDFPDDAVTVRIETGHRLVTAIVGDRSVTVAAPATSAVQAVGLIGRGTGLVACSWDNVWAGNGR